jgi:Tol biopolymer transport system component
MSSHLFGGTALMAGLVLACAACCPNPKTAAKPGPEKPAAPKAAIDPREVHFADMRQLTFGGENAEAYWSFDGSELVFQSRPAGEGCDQIFRLAIANPKQIERVSSGKGVTTCSYFMPGNDRILYSSTHLASPECPPRPDHSKGYVWPLHADYDILLAKRDGSDVTKLTDSPRYDAEATVCAKDGSIVFTSLRDGDLELYRMDADGKNVVRLTNTPGYDGGAFFSADCSKIVWRASRPEGEDLESYQKLLGQNLVSPKKLEIYVANADGSDPRQVTYLNAASFAPFFFPSGDRILFSTNYEDPKGREFDIWAVDVDGTDLERITYTAGFDGFPMFSPDGKTLAFASNRATAEGAQDTNVFLVRWVDRAPKVTETAADRLRIDVDWLAAPERGGRGIGMPGLEASGAYIEARYAALGLTPLSGKSYRQPFPITTAVSSGGGTKLSLDGKEVGPKDWIPLGASSTGAAEGELVFADWGISADGVRDDYAKLNVKDKIVLVRRFAPDELSPEDKRRYSDLRYKAWVARQRGAKALLVVDSPTVAKGETVPDEAPLPELSVERQAAIPMAALTRAVGAPLLAKLAKKQKARAAVSVELVQQQSEVFNVVAKLPATGQARGAIVIGAHYDHLGMGGPNSLHQGDPAPHVGADDNASGVAALLEVARQLKAVPQRSMDVWFVAFSAEESGVLGSVHFVENLPPGLRKENMVAMLNMDMVGRMRENVVSALGGDSAAEWPELVGAACKDARIRCITGGGGIGPSDQTSFYAVDVPVLHFFSGSHEDYHKPSDTPDRINAAGAAQIAAAVGGVALGVMTRGQPLTFKRVASPPPAGDLRGYGASLGTIPDYVGPRHGESGMLLAGVRPGGAAEKAGMQKGDILVELGPFKIGDVNEMMFALRASKPGDTMKAVVLRDGKRLELPVTLEKSTRRQR